MPRHIKFGLIALLVITLAGVSFYYNLRKRIQEFVQRPAEPPQPYLATGPVISDSALPKKVRLFFPSREKEGFLMSEEREIRASELGSTEAKQIVAELIRGPGTAGGLALPHETKLRELFILKEGLAVVDFTKEVSSHHPGGITQELASVYSVVNSLTQNVVGVKNVQILIEGTDADTLAGHVDISHPIAEDLSMTSIAPGQSNLPGKEREQPGNPSSHAKQRL